MLALAGTATTAGLTFAYTRMKERLVRERKQAAYFKSKDLKNAILTKLERNFIILKIALALSAGGTLLSAYLAFKRSRPAAMPHPEIAPIAAQNTPEAPVRSDNTPAPDQGQPVPTPAGKSNAPAPGNSPQPQPEPATPRRSGNPFGAPNPDAPRRAPMGVTPLNPDDDVRAEIIDDEDDEAHNSDGDEADNVKPDEGDLYVQHKEILGAAPQTKADVLAAIKRMNNALTAVTTDLSNINKLINNLPGNRPLQCRPDYFMDVYGHHYQNRDKLIAKQKIIKALIAKLLAHLAELQATAHPAEVEEVD